MATKGQKFKQWTAEEKLECIKPYLNMEKSSHEIAKEKEINNSMIVRWSKEYKESGLAGLTPKKKPGNPMCKYSNRKKLTTEEKLEYENMKLRIENEMLKKGFLMKEDGTYVKFIK